MRRLQQPLIAAAVIVVAILAVLGWMTWKAHPIWRAATARVVAIAPSQARFHPDDSSVVVRNATGTGQFTVTASMLRCQVGDMVAVQQAGVTLRAVRRTCR